MKKIESNDFNSKDSKNAIKLRARLPYLLMIKHGPDTVAVLNYGNGKKTCFSFPDTDSSLYKRLGNIELGLVLPKKKKSLMYILTEKDERQIIWEVGGSKDSFPVILTLYAQIDEERLIMLNIIEELGKKSPMREHIIMPLEYKDFFATEIFTRLVSFLPIEKLLPHISKAQLIEEKAGE